MFYSEYHTALTVALAILLFLAVFRLYQLRGKATSRQRAEGGPGETEALSELLEHEEITPLLNDLAAKVEVEFGFDWPEFSLESDRVQDEPVSSGSPASSRLIRIDQDLTVRFRWRDNHNDSETEIRLDAVERLTRACVLNIRRIERYKRLADRDPLTGLFNVAYLRLRLKEEVERAARFRRSVGVLILDVDHFKRINDTRGHLTGDKALRFLARLVIESVRSIDIVCRYGGDELCIILPDATEATMRGTMNRLRNLIHDGSSEATGLALTVSIGGALSVFGATSPGELFESADRAMLRAKRRGRDQVFFTAPEVAETDLSESE